MDYPYAQVGEGEIRRSDILFAIGDETREAVGLLESAKTSILFLDTFRYAGGFW